MNPQKTKNKDLNQKRKTTEEGRAVYDVNKKEKNWKSREKQIQLREKRPPLIKLLGSR